MPPPRSRAGPPPSANARAAEPDACPIEDRELSRLFGGLEGLGDIVLAVSGGADSLAMLLLVAHWVRRVASAPPRLHVITVDHGLRPEATTEARQVAAIASGLGLAHATLVWQGEKPKTGLPAKARAARYRLLLEAAKRLGANAILTAHTRDDQAETVLMRLARGSGLDGLSGMAPAGEIGGIALLRPLIGHPRSRLVTTLEREGLSWIEDPSNENAAHERVRLRLASGQLHRLGLGNEALATTARRLQRARLALEHGVDALARTAAVLAPAGYAEIDLAALRLAPEEIALRLLGRALAVIGAATEPTRLARLERAFAGVLAPDAKPVTLGGCRILPRGRRLLVCREAGRSGLPTLELAPGTQAVWDCRLVATCGPGEPAPLVVRAPTASELKGLADAGHWRRGTLPLEAARTAPAFFRNDQLVAAPLHGVASADGPHLGLVRSVLGTATA